MTRSQPKVALVYDWVTAEYGGAEHILQELHALFPDAPLYTSVWNQEKTPWTKGWNIITSFLQNITLFKNNHTLAAPLLPLAFESFDFKEFDVIISVTSFAAKGVITLPHQLHLSYVLTPPRFLYTHKDSYWQQFQQNSFLTWLAQPVIQYLKRWDQVAALRPDTTIVISDLVSQRIKDIYRFSADSIIYPPIPPLSATGDLEENTFSIKDYIVTGGRLVRYKQFELVLDLAEAVQKPVVIFGDGPEMPALQQKADTLSVPVIMTGKIPTSKLTSILSNAKVAVYPAIEDFGITQVQVAYLGIPTIIHAQTGATELLSSFKNVITIKESSVPDLQTAYQSFEKSGVFQHLQPKTKIYDTTTFGTEFLAAVLTAWKGIKV